MTDFNLRDEMLRELKRLKRIMGKFEGPDNDKPAPPSPNYEINENSKECQIRLVPLPRPPRRPLRPPLRLLLVPIPSQYISHRAFPDHPAYQDYLEVASQMGAIIVPDDDQYAVIDQNLGCFYIRLEDGDTYFTPVECLERCSHNCKRNPGLCIVMDHAGNAFDSNFNQAMLFVLAIIHSIVTETLPQHVLKQIKAKCHKPNNAPFSDCLLPINVRNGMPFNRDLLRNELRELFAR